MKPKDLKTILMSKRAYVYYLEMCRVMQKDERVVYFVENATGDGRYWNIPYANTTCLLLGTGTSITQAAVRLLSQAGVAIGFCGGGGTPLFAGTDIVWMTSQSEYRPTQYVQNWVSFWYDDKKRLEAAKYLQKKRMEYSIKVMEKDREYISYGLPERYVSVINGHMSKIDNADSIQDLLSIEGEFVKKLYASVATATDYGDFTRDKDSNDEANEYLSHGNYLAYGLGATVLWSLGIPHAFALMHGKTRRGALVFDVADLVKDSIVLPMSFISSVEGDDDGKFRRRVLEKFAKYDSLDFLFETVERIAIDFGGSL